MLALTAARPDAFDDVPLPVGTTRPDDQTQTIRAAFDLARDAITRGDGSTAVAMCQQILTEFPSDVWAQFLLGQGYVQLGENDLAIKSFEGVVDRDPESAEARLELGRCYRAVDRLDVSLDAATRAFELAPDRPEIRDLLADLRRRLNHDGELPLAPPSAVGRWHLQRGDALAALEIANAELSRSPRDVLLQLLRAEALWRANLLDEAERACRQLVTRYPRTIKPRLILGCILCADLDREIDGVELLHATNGDDLAGVVSGRLTVRTEFHFPALADEITIRIAAVADSIASDKPFASPTTPFDARKWSALVAPERVPPDVQSVADAAGNPVTELFLEPTGPEPELVDPPAIAVVDGVGPAERLIAVTSKSALIARYGPDAIERLDRRGRAVRRELAAFDTGFDVIYLDDGASLAELECSPATSKQPEAMRRAIIDVVHAIRGRSVDSCRIGILLLGGDDVVPFFRVPNPADDDDVELLTDNPYGAPDGSSPLTPVLPVGRLPDGSSDNLSLVLRQLDLLVDARRRPRVPGRPRGLGGLGRLALQSLRLGRATTAPFAWSSADVESVTSQILRSLSPASIVRSSPPELDASFDPAWLGSRRCLHFSLNGGPDGYHWFGQAAPDESSDEWQTPIAVASERLVGLSLNAPVVFAALGYSAALPSETQRSTIAARFLYEGAAAFVGSTGLSYGSGLLPLAGADLLASRFWSNLSLGQPVGVALAAAKQSYARQLADEQGYLDGDDQKTLLEFCLYGDPLLPVFEQSVGQGNTDERLDPDEEVTQSLVLLCNRGGNGRQSVAAEPSQVRAALEVIGARCPESIGGSIRVQRRAGCAGNCGHLHHDNAYRSGSRQEFGVVSITARAEIPVGLGESMVKIARVSLSDDDQIAKALVSR